MTTKTFTQIMQENRCEEWKRNTKALILADGTRISVQASDGHYCAPRYTNLESYEEYVEFEIGYPSVKIEEFMPYCEDVSRPTETVYGYVPKHVIEAVIKSRGGVIGVAV